MNVNLLARPLGNTSGNVSSGLAFIASGSLASFGAYSSSSASVASDPRETAARPILGGALIASNQAEE